MTDEVIGRVLASCREAGLDGACLVGIDSVPPMDRIRALAADFPVFFGVEMSLARGRLVWIPSDPEQLRGDLPIGRNLEEIVTFFKDNGGVLFAAHPYDRSDGASFMDACYDLFDISGIEVANAGRDPWRNNMAQDAAVQLKLKGFGGTGRREPGPGEIGAAATLVLDDVNTQAELIAQLGREDCWALEFLSDASQFGEDSGEQERPPASHERPRQGRPQGGRGGQGGGPGRPEGHGGQGGGQDGRGQDGRSQDGRQAHGGQEGRQGHQGHGRQGGGGHRGGQGVQGGQGGQGGRGGQGQPAGEPRAPRQGNTR